MHTSEHILRAADPTRRKTHIPTMESTHTHRDEDVRTIGRHLNQQDPVACA